MALAFVDEWRSQDFSESGLPAFAPLDLKFEPARLIGEIRGKGIVDFAPWSLTMNGLAVTPVHHQLDHEEIHYRVSARESGAAIADFERLEVALSFAGAVGDLDWSGNDLGAIKERNQEAVGKAYLAWTRPRISA